jgi:hypothetical protein
MLLGWRTGNSVGRYVLIDALFPWPALHYGRNAMRDWAKDCSKFSPGPFRMDLGLTTAVKETGQAELRVWPMGKGYMPRRWNDGDTIWREPLKEMRRFVGRELACETRLEFMPSDQEMVRAQTVASLRDRKGFWGWRRGEREPTAQIQRSINRGLAAQLAARAPVAERIPQWL